MKREKGFTLIELLAVIVILAVIALIATPIIIGIIEDSKIKANENSAYGIVDSAKYYYTQGLLKPENTIKYNENIIDELSYNGEHPKPGSWTSVDKEGNVGIALLYGNKCFLKEYSESKIKEGDKDNCKISIPTDTLTLKDTLTKPENLVTSGNGLYKISDTEYKYRGGCNIQGSAGSYTCADTDPIHNYIKLGSYLYRIIGIDANGIKVISANKLENKAFDPDNTNIFDTGDSNTNNIGYYLNKDANALEEIKYLRTVATTAIWNIGAVTYGANRPLTTVKTEEKATTSSFQIGLMNASDYIEGSTNVACLGDPVINSSNSQACRNNNWLFNTVDNNPLTINPRAATSDFVWRVYSNYSNLIYGNANYTFGLRSVAYLSSDTLVKSGDGTQENPYTLN